MIAVLAVVAMRLSFELMAIPVIRQLVEPVHA
jgi:hypothetical protein